MGGLRQHTDLRVGEIIGLRVRAFELPIGRTWARLHVDGSRLGRYLGRMLEGVDLGIIGTGGTLHAQGWGWIGRTRRTVHRDGRVAGRDHMRRLGDGRIRREAFRGHGVSWSKWGIWPRLPLVTGQSCGVVVDFESLTGTNLVEII